MNTIKAYKIISFILAPFACFWGMAALISLFMSLMNIAFFFQALLAACITAYIILSFIFLIRGISQNKNCNPSLKKWIRRTGTISFIFTCLSLFQSLFLLTKPMTLSSIIDQMQNLQKDMPQVDSHLIISTLRTLLYILIFFAVTLIVHYIETVKFLKIYSSVFNKNAEQ